MEPNSLRFSKQPSIGLNTATRRSCFCIYSNLHPVLYSLSLCIYVSHAETYHHVSGLKEMPKFLIFTVFALCSTHLILFKWIIPQIYGHKYKLWCSSLRNCLHHSVNFVTSESKVSATLTLRLRDKLMPLWDITMSVLNIALTSTGKTIVLHNTDLAECVFCTQKGNREDGAACSCGQLIYLSQVQENIESCDWKYCFFPVPISNLYWLLHYSTTSGRELCPCTDIPPVLHVL